MKESACYDMIILKSISNDDNDQYVNPNESLSHALDHPQLIDVNNIQMKYRYAMKRSGEDMEH